jgi:hypothetical protein
MHRLHSYLLLSYSLLCAFCCLYTTIYQQLADIPLQCRNLASVRVGCTYIRFSNAQREHLYTTAFRWLLHTYTNVIIRTDKSAEILEIADQRVPESAKFGYLNG